MADRETVLKALRDSGTEVARQLRTMAADQFEAGRYENGWNARQILAHVASVEWTYPRLLTTAAAPAGETGESRAPAARGGFDAYNARQVEKRATHTPAELIAEFQRNRQTTVDAVRNAEPGLFEARIRSAGGAQGTLGEVLLQVAVAHVEEHLRDIMDGA